MQAQAAHRVGDRLPQQPTVNAVKVVGRKVRYSSEGVESQRVIQVFGEILDDALDSSRIAVVLFHGAARLARTV